MSAFQMGLSYHLNADRQTSPLLLQFLLSEYIHVVQHFRLIEALVNKEKISTPHLALLSKFSGLPPNQAKTFQWSPDQGGLSKLHFYAIYFSEQMQTSSDNIPDLEKNCRECRILGARLLELAGNQHKEGVGLTLKKLKRYLWLIAKNLVDAVILHRDNENVLYFLLRHKTQIDSIYNNNFTLRLLNNLFPNGLQEAQSFLIEKYLSRGFNKEAEKIRQHFTSII